MGPKSTFQSDPRWEFASTLLPTLWGPWGVLREIINLRSSLLWRLSRTKHGEGGGEKSEWMRKGDGFSLEASRGYRALGTRGGRRQEDPAVQKLDGVQMNMLVTRRLEEDGRWELASALGPHKH